MDFFDTTQSGLAAAAGGGSGSSAESVDEKAEAAIAPCDDDDDDDDEAGASEAALGLAYAETGVIGTTSVGDERSSSPTNRAVGRRGCADEKDDDADDDCDADDDANGMLVAGRCVPEKEEKKTQHARFARNGKISKYKQRNLKNEAVSQ